jgi:hypothetical protein
LLLFSKRSAFFFEEKKQKTFIHLLRGENQNVAVAAGSAGNA